MDPSELKGRKIGRVLTKMGVVTREQVHEALGVQKGQTQKSKLGELMVELGMCTELDVDKALAGQAGLEYIDLTGFEPDEETIGAIPAENAKAYQCVPIEYEPKTKRLKVAIKGPENFQAVDNLRLLMGAKVEAAVASPDMIDKLLEKHYAKSESLQDVVGALASDDRFAGMGVSDQSIDLEAVLDAADDNQVIKLLNLVLLQAIKDRASDIHLEPFENEFKIRYRIDGVLYEMVPPPKHLGAAITSRVKVMADLDIAERRLPQDGRIELTVGGSPVDLRVAVLPTIYGESVVMRVLDRSNVELSLDRVGFRSEELELFRGLIHKPNGIVIVTGPTGSGKTTTLYAALDELNDIRSKVLTAEDPVEYDIDGLCQVQMNSEVGLTFARALRSFLRQDPDVILVGEIRDLETAQIAVQASLTGHLVLTTLHTNDAPSSIIRLVDLGIEPFLLTATIEGVVAQRLVRKLDPDNKEAFTPSETELMELSLRPEDVQSRQFYRPKNTSGIGGGYKGRMALFEIMTIDDETRELIVKNASTEVLRDLARKKGMRSLRESGLLSIYEGVTTIDEVVRETLAEE